MSYLHYNSLNYDTVQMVKTFKSIGVDYSYVLTLLDTDLIHINPYDPDLTSEFKRKILKECMVNPFYYIREIARNTKGEPFVINPAMALCMKLFFNGNYVALEIPDVHDRDNLLVEMVKAFDISTLNSGIHMISGMSTNHVENLMHTYHAPDIFDALPALKVRCEYDVTGNYGVYSHRGTAYNSALILDGHLNKNLEKILNTITPPMAFNLHKSEKTIVGNYGLGGIVVSSNTTSLSKSASDWGERLVKKDFDIKDEVLDDAKNRGLMVYIKCDYIDLNLDLYKVFESFMSVYTKSELKAANLLRPFAFRVLNKDYDKLDVLEKMVINREFTELYKQYISKIFRTELENKVRPYSIITI